MSRVKGKGEGKSEGEGQGQGGGQGQGHGAARVKVRAKERAVCSTERAEGRAGGRAHVVRVRVVQLVHEPVHDRMRLEAKTSTRVERRGVSRPLPGA